MRKNLIYNNIEDNNNINNNQEWDNKTIFSRKFILFILNTKLLLDPCCKFEYKINL